MDMTGKRILITGEGRGKTFIADLLMDRYSGEMVPFEIIHVSSLSEAQSLDIPDEGCQIVVSNIPLPGFDYWQRIEVSGG